MKVILILFTLVIVDCVSAEISSCTTPDNQTGKCVDVYACSHILDLIRTKDPEKIYFVKKSQCEGPTKYSVCCGTTAKNNNVHKCTASPTPNADCCGVDGTAGYKLISGPVTLIDEYTWLALIEYVQGAETKVLCGGSLISSKHVLTAAHCVAGEILDLGKPTNVRLGEYDTAQKNPDCVDWNGFMDCTDDLVVIPIKTIIKHHKYNHIKSLQNDIAILTLEKMVPYTDFIRPICLPSSDITALKKSSNNQEQYRRTKLAGWGTSGFRSPSNNKKQHADVQILSKKECQKIYENITLSDGQFCAGGQGGLPLCSVDSGGPLMDQEQLRFHVIGIASIGADSCKNNEPIIYTNVYHYLPWIDSITAV